MSSSRGGFGGIAIVLVFAAVAVAAFVAVSALPGTPTGVASQPSASGYPLATGNSIPVTGRSVQGVPQEITGVSSLDHTVTFHGAPGPSPMGGPSPGPTDAPFAPEVRVTSDPNDQTHPSIASDPAGANIYIAYTNQVTPTNQDIWVAKSTDGGATWTNGAVMAMSYNEFAPSITIHGSSVYIFYASDDPAIPRGYHYAVSPDGGLTWNIMTIDFGAAGPFTTIRAPSASSSGGAAPWLYVAYQAFCDVVANCGGAASQVFFVSLFNAAGTIVPPTIYFGFGVNIIDPVVASGPTNTFVLADYDGSAPPINGPPGTHDIFWAHAVTGTGTWTGLAVSGVLSDDVIRPAATAFGTNLVAPYQLVNATATGLPNHVIIALYSSNDGTTIGVRFAAGAAGVESKDPAASGAVPTAHITFYQNGNLGYTNSTSPFATWRPMIKVNSNVGTVVDAVRSNAIVMIPSLGPTIAWHDTRDGNANIYTTGLQKFAITIATVPTGLGVRFGSTGAYANAPITQSFPSGSRITVETFSPQLGTPGVRYLFRNWNDSSTNPVKPVVVSSAMTWTASFSTQYETAIASNPAGRTITVNATSFTAPYTFWCNATSTVTIGAPSPQPISGTDRWRFDTWSDAGTQNHTITCSMPRTITASFIEQFLIRFRTSPLPLQMNVAGTLVTTPFDLWADTGSTIALIAPTPQVTSPGIRYVFVNWNDAITANTRAVAVTASTTWTANYQLQYQTTFETNPAGLQLIVAGSTVTAPGSVWCDATPGSTVSGTAISPQFVGVGTRYTFSAWSDGNPALTDTLACDATRTVTAVYITEYFLTMSANFGTVSPGNGWYSNGTVVPVTATAPAGTATERYVFQNWTGDYQGTTAAGSLAMNGPKTIRAIWIHQFQNTIQTTPSGQSITIDGVMTPTPANPWWAEGSSHTLVAPPNVTVTVDTRLLFASWNPGGSTTRTYTVGSVSSSLTYTATFTRQFRYLVVTSPASGPKVLVDGTAYTGEVWFNEGTTHSIDAQASQSGGTGTRYVFKSWETASTTALRSVQATAPATFTATYDTQYQLTVTSTYGNPTCAGATDPSGCWYLAGSQATASVTSPFTASDGNKYVITAWSGDASGAGASSNPITMDGPKTATAAWRQVTFLEEYGVLLGALLVIIIVVVVLLLFLLMRRRKKGKEEEEMGPQPETSEAPPPPPGK